MKTVEWLLLALVGALAVLVLILAAMSRRTTEQSRGTGEYSVAEAVTMTQAGSGTACQSEFRFTLGRIDHTETLAFFINHHNVQVDVSGECVCTVTAADDRFATGGKLWVMVPLYETDSGQEVRVLLMPLYENYQAKPPEFLLDSELAVQNAALHQALPALILSLCVIFAGVLLIGLGLYHTARGMFSGRLYALGLMSISMGSRRIAYDRVTYLLLADQAVLIYTLSIISLMSAALCMLNSLHSTMPG